MASPTILSQAVNDGLGLRKINMFHQKRAIAIPITGSKLGRSERRSPAESAFIKLGGWAECRVVRGASARFQSLLPIRWRP